MPFNTQYYFHRTLFYLTTPLFAVLLYLFGDNPEYFDLIYIGALGLSCLFCWQDKDTLGALIILLGFWVLSRVFYYVPENSYSLVLVYSFAVLVTFVNIQQTTAKILILLTLFCISAEFFWHYTDYPNKPEIYYYIGLLAIIEITRELLFKRVILMAKYFDYISGKIALDWQIRMILLAYFTLVFFMALEYLIRHLASMSNLTLVYYNYTMIANLISAITLTAVFMHYFHNQAQKHIEA